MLVLVLVALLFLFGVWLVWLSLVVVVPGRCVPLCVRSLGLWSGRCLSLVLVLLLLLCLVLGWLALLWLFVLVFVRFLARSGSFLFLWFASFFLGGLVPFFCVKRLIKGDLLRDLRLAQRAKRTRMKRANLSAFSSPRHSFQSKISSIPQKQQNVRGERQLTPFLISF